LLGHLISSDTSLHLLSFTAAVTLHLLLLQADHASALEQLSAAQQEAAAAQADAAAKASALAELQKQAESSQRALAAERRQVSGLGKAQEALKQQLAEAQVRRENTTCVGQING
jgi:septal ring factor EnvC (AmiA/AmiB activator)